MEIFQCELQCTFFSNFITMVVDRLLDFSMGLLVKKWGSDSSSVSIPVKWKHLFLIPSFLLWDFEHFKVYISLRKISCSNDASRFEKKSQCGHCYVFVDVMFILSWILYLGFRNGITDFGDLVFSRINDEPQTHLALLTALTSFYTYNSFFVTLLSLLLIKTK